MIKKATILNAIEIFDSKSVKSSVMGRLQPDDFIDWIKEEYHNSKFWLVVELPSGKKGYIDSESAFRWKECQLRNTHAKMYLENSEEIIHLKKGDTLYQIHPENKETGEAKSHVKRVADEKLNIGKIKYASLKTKFGSDDVFAIISMISAAILCLLIIYWAVITMIIGGRIFYGGLIITAVIVLWKFLSTLIMHLLKSIRLFFYKIAIRSA